MRMIPAQKKGPVTIGVITVRARKRRRVPRKAPIVLIRWSSLFSIGDLLRAVVTLMMTMTRMNAGTSIIQRFTIPGDKIELFTVFSFYIH